MKATLYAAAAAAAALSHSASAATSAQWRSKSIYQVLTDRFARTDGSITATCNTEDRVYCGGTYQGIINQLDYIQGMGFSAIWISPVVENLPEGTGYGEAYHGYWQQDLYSLNSNFGTADDLKNLAAELHDRDMYLMVDIVVNHNGWAGSASSVDYSRFNPFNSQDYYHSACTVDYSSQDSVEDCWLGDNTVALVDLNTEDPRVVEGYEIWISQLVANYSIDGLRIDTAKHVDKAFYPGFEAAAGVFATGEVFDGNPSYTCDYQNYIDSVLNYPIYYPLVRAFTSPSGSISDLVNMIATLKSGCKDTTLLGTFSENHDITRFAGITSDLSQAKNVLAFNILTDGIPIIYAGQEQHYAGVEDPNNREATWLSGYNTDAELYKLIASVNTIRAQAIADDERYLTYQNWVIYSDTTTIAMRKGYDGSQVITVLSNKGANGDGYTLDLSNTGYTSGTELVEVYTCATATVSGSGTVPVPMSNGLPRIYYPTAKLAGSGICDL